MSFKITKWCLPLRKKWKHRLLVCDAAALLLLTLLLLCSSCELCCASTRTSPGCLRVLLQHLSCSCKGSACCCFCCALPVKCTFCFNSHHSWLLASAVTCAPLQKHFGSCQNFCSTIREHFDSCSQLYNVHLWDPSFVI